MQSVQRKQCNLWKRPVKTIPASLLSPYSHRQRVKHLILFHINVTHFYYRQRPKKLLWILSPNADFKNFEQEVSHLVLAAFILILGTLIYYCIFPHQTYFSETFNALAFSQTAEINNQSRRKGKTKEDNTSFLQWRFTFVVTRPNNKWMIR